MADKILKVKKLSESTVVVTETSQDTIGIEIGSGCIFMGVEDLYPFIRLMKEIDGYFFKK